MQHGPRATRFFARFKVVFGRDEASTTTTSETLFLFKVAEAAIDLLASQSLCS